MFSNVANHQKNPHVCWLNQHVQNHDLHAQIPEFS